MPQPSPSEQQQEEKRMCDFEVCADSCKHRARLGALAGVALGCLAAWQVVTRVLDAAGPVLRDAVVAVVVAGTGIVCAALVLGGLRVYRRRRVLSRGVLVAAGVPAAVIPGVGVPLALMAGAAVWTGVLTVAAGWVMARWVLVIVRGAVESRRPGAYEALPRPVRAPVRPLPPAPLHARARVTVISRHDERAV
jgi:hypothetical protein